MIVALRLVRPALREAVRGRRLLGLAASLALAGELLIRFGGGGETTLVSLLDVALIVTPLAALVVGTMQVHNAREMTELLLAQPIARRTLFAGLYLGTALPLACALTIGLLAPFAWHGLLFGALGLRLLALGAVTAVLTLVGTALAFSIALRADDRVRALGVSLAIWLGAAVLWDGIILLVALMFGERAIEVPMLAALALNPLDLARVLLLLGTDAAALFGYTGAVVQHTMGTTAGHLMLTTALALWLALPLRFAARTFQHKDF
ncbi:MAG: ABC transporter permease subunit [Gemmatimonadota bacterium]